MITDRHAGAIMLALSAALLVYVLTAPWTFAEMRDGMRIGAFPLAYLALCLLFAAWTMLGRGAGMPIEGAEYPSLFGVVRIGTFIVCGLLISFFHQQFGFAALSFVSLLIFGRFMGLTSLRGLLLYSAAVTAALFGLFSLLGFGLTIFPDFSRLGG